MTVTLMSRSEIDRMNVLRDLAEERIRVSEAATLIGLAVARCCGWRRHFGNAALLLWRRADAGNQATVPIRGFCGLK